MCTFVTYLKGLIYYYTLYNIYSTFPASTTEMLVPMFLNPLYESPEQDAGQALHPANTTTLETLLKVY